MNEVADDSALLRRQAKEIEELRAQVAQLQAAGCVLAAAIERLGSCWNCCCNVLSQDEVLLLLPLVPASTALSCIVVAPAHACMPLYPVCALPLP